jgi:TPR repeat protein
MTLHGRGVSRDPVAACRGYEAAAQAGYTDAEYMTGECHRTGQGVPRDGALALAWYLKAARKGHPGAQLMAASTYLTGEGWRSEPQKALVWAEVARLSGETQAVALVERIGREMRNFDKAEALEQASVCWQGGYRACPE